MSSEKIILEIRREAEERVAAIRKETEEGVQNIIDEAQKEAGAGYAAAMKKGIGEIREEERRLISLAGLEANELVRETKEKGISDCFSEADKRLSDISSSVNYPAILAGLIEEGKKAVGGDELIILTRREDLETVNGIIAGEKCLSSGEGETRDAGVIVLSEKLNVRIDQTFPERLKRMKKRLTHDTAVMLYGRI